MSNAALLMFLLGTATATAPSPATAPLSGEHLTGVECEVVSQSGATPAQDDENRARAACQSARARFAELFGDPVPEVKVILWDESHYRMGLLRGEAAIFWPSSEAMTPRTDDSAAAEDHVAAQWREVLPHEISHLLLAVRFFRDAAATPPGEYGTPLPDWLDEAAAIWAEPLESRRRRVDQARELPNEYRDLRAILTKAHPATGKSGAYIARDGSAHPADFTLWAFYPQAIAALTFVHEHGGTAATSELVERFLNGWTGPRALAGLPGLPAESEEVEQLWNEWLSEGNGAR